MNQPRHDNRFMADVVDLLKKIAKEERTTILIVTQITASSTWPIGS